MKLESGGGEGDVGVGDGVVNADGKGAIGDGGGAGVGGSGEKGECAVRRREIATVRTGNRNGKGEIGGGGDGGVCTANCERTAVRNGKLIARRFDIDSIGHDVAVDGNSSGRDDDVVERREENSGGGLKGGRASRPSGAETSVIVVPDGRNGVPVFIGDRRHPNIVGRVSCRRKSNNGNE